MEANFLRLALKDVKKILLGKRVEKIYYTPPGVWSFRFSYKNFLLISLIPRKRFLCIQKEGIDNPSLPPAKVMYLRKYLKKKRVKDLVSFWWKREFWLDFGGLYLALGLDREPYLSDSLPKEEMIWPSLEDIENTSKIYLKYPQLSPPVRKKLAALVKEDRVEFWQRLKRGDFSTAYVYGDNILLWPTKDKVIFESNNFLDAMEVYAKLHLKEIFNLAKEELKEKKEKSKKLKKTLKKIDLDLQNLRNKLSFSRKGELIKNNLFKLNKEDKVEQIEVMNEKGEIEVIKLNPKLSIKENMLFFFKQAEKAKRGLIILEQRKQHLQNLLGTVQEEKKKSEEVKNKQIILPKKYQGLAVKVFVSSDGFLILRGKNQKANHKLLNLASAFDLWFHVQDGPGAHVFLRRDSAKQEVPEKSLKEAAILAALSSYRREDKKASVMYTEVKFLRRHKKLPLGEVLIDKILGSLQIELDKGLEEKLLWRKNNE